MKTSTNFIPFDDLILDKSFDGIYGTYLCAHIGYIESGRGLCRVGIENSHYWPTEELALAELKQIYDEVVRRYGK